MHPPNAICSITMEPFLHGTRSYLPVDHEFKDAQSINKDKTEIHMSKLAICASLTIKQWSDVITQSRALTTIPHHAPET